MKVKFFIPLFVIYALSLTAQQKFIVNLNNRADDNFKVTLFPDGLSGKNNIYHFAATAPGMYQIIDAGRFVNSFKAFDKKGKEIKTEKKSTNEWSLSNPSDIYKIEYSIADTWDTTLTENPIYRMGGTSIEDDNVVINGPDVFGYFEGKQADPVYVKIDYPADWTIGTALKKDNDGYYRAKDYDQIVDSPFLLGHLTQSTLDIDDTEIDIYTYSKTGMVKSDDIMESAEGVFKALDKYVDGLPVERYVLLFHFEDRSEGAWEHNYSSFYVYQESPFNPMLQNQVREVIAHETFHMITPLHIHSEVIEHFNFSNPVLSQHLWLYEGVTEWASNMLQLRGGLETLDHYLGSLRQELMYSELFDQSISLRDISLNSFKLQTQFLNVYQRGAFVAGLLDLKLLQLSEGKRGLREVILELAKKYGTDKPFNENTFFDDFAKMTYPEINDFFNSYIINSEPLPVKEYYSTIGINYYENKGVDSSRVSLGFGIGLEGYMLKITSVEGNKDAQPGDLITKVNGQELNENTLQPVFMSVQRMKVGDSINLTVKRGEEEKEFTVKLQPFQIKHVFEVNPNASPEQVQLREAWMKKL